MNQREAWFWLNQLPGIGNEKIRKLLTIFEQPEHLLAATDRELSALTFLREQDRKNLLSIPQREESLRLYEDYIQRGICFVFPYEESYPRRLLQLYDFPFVLYYRGRLPEESRKAVAIVGSRNCSDYGRYMAGELGRRLGIAGVSVISGLAKGIDACAHQGALQGKGSTYAVLAGSAYSCYPKEHEGLYEEICKTGGVVSEFPPGTPTVPGLFPIRNRIISGLSDAVVIVEAARKSGSLITASQALEQNREVYAVPGRVGDPCSEGCNSLIAEGAAILNDFENFLNSLGISADHVNDSIVSEIGLASSEKMLYSLLLDFTPRSLESLIQESRLEVHQVYQNLMQLELKGLIKEKSKHFYVRIR